jgi:hypothetical protein
MAITHDKAPSNPCLLLLHQLRFTTAAGAPPHQLKLSKNCVAMITRNLEGKFKNGRRVVVLYIGARSVQVVDAEAYAREKAYPPHSPNHRPCLPSDFLWVPRILFEWPHRRIGLLIQRRQFPLRLAYAVTFNKSQGKTLSRAVVDIRNQAFAHGQLYVALSRVKLSTDIMILCSAASVIGVGAGQFISATNVVERKALVQAMPVHLRPQFEADYPVPA